MRLTRKQLQPNMGFNDIAEMIKKLSDLEDIEQELGIDLITLFKALKNGIYINDKVLDKVIYLNKDMFGINLKEKIITYAMSFPGPEYLIYYFKDYGKTWALTKEIICGGN